MLSGRDMFSSEVLAEMSQLGVSRRTVFNAKKELGVQAYRKENVWYWRLPEALTGCHIDLKQEISKKQNGGTDDEGQ
jgi:hypothetical protein